MRLHFVYKKGRMLILAHKVATNADFETTPWRWLCVRSYMVFLMLVMRVNMYVLVNVTL